MILLKLHKVISMKDGHLTIYVPTISNLYFYLSFMKSNNTTKLQIFNKINLLRRVVTIIYSLSFICLIINLF